MRRLYLLVLFLALALPPSARAQPTPPTWPRTIVVGTHHVTIYQPQAISWTERKTLTARAAIALPPSGEPHPILGTLDLAFTTTVEGEWVALTDPRLLSSHFPALETKRAMEVEAKIRAFLAKRELPRVPLASVLVSLGQKPPVTNAALDNTPPKIFVSDRPASLVVFDGEPVITPLGTSGLGFAVNTNWSVFRYRGTWYLLNNGLWLAAADASGPYHPVFTLPTAFEAVPNDTSFAEVRKAIPPHPAGTHPEVPRVFVSTTPAAIIVTAGPPKFVPVSGTGLQVVKNTASTLFFDPGLGKFYLLLSGRWFSAPALAGPWTFASENLPPDFALIPAGSPEAPVLASVPGTVAAEQAVLEASVPHTATLTRATTKFSVTYSGAPLFRPVPGTSLRYAVNTEATVLELTGRYYACANGAWFVAPSPTGPWALADSVPSAITAIPPASPLYPVTYVQVYNTSPTTVTYGYTAGYLMGFVTGGLLVYGTGYYYPPVVLPGRVPIYYPYPYTYAGNVWYNGNGAWVRGGSVYGSAYGATGARAYNPGTGAWAQGAAVYGPYGGAGAWSRYNPTTGAYAHGSAVWGGGSGSASAHYYNPRTGVSATTNQNVNPYQRWGASTLSGPSQTISTRSGANARGSAGAFTSTSGAEGGGYRGVQGNRGAVVQGSGGNVYAGRDGNVYQHTDGGWAKWNNGGWQSVTPPNNRAAGGQNWRQLQQDRLGRTAGEASLRSGGGFAGQSWRQPEREGLRGGAGAGAGGRFGGSRARR